MRKIIFLDIDGVLNHQSFYIKRHQEKLEGKFHIDYPNSEFCPKSVSYLNEITSICNAEIVLSSTWRLGRTDEEIVKLFKEVGITGKYIGKTDDMSYKNHLISVERGSEINHYLSEVLKFSHINWCKETQQKYIESSGIDNYIILDDDSDMLYDQRNHFIHTLPFPRNNSGLNEKYRDQAIETLSKTVIDLNY